MIRVTISGPLDREHLVADLLVEPGSEPYDFEQMAEINVEEGPPVIEIFPRQDGKYWTFPLDEFLEALTKARARLLGD